MVRRTSTVVSGGGTRAVSIAFTSSAWTRPSFRHTTKSTRYVFSGQPRRTVTWRSHPHFATPAEQVQDRGDGSLRPWSRSAPRQPRWAWRGRVDDRRSWFVLLLDRFPFGQGVGVRVGGG